MAQQKYSTKRRTFQHPTREKVDRREEFGHREIDTVV